ncbi:hypothetical protein FGG08_005200 [Glutinoglossum americanum]|uniref:Beach-domain-containing protein n=1 Tax=Glutinoglossum americanum TaxID=1670608 RepID=A0A9P8L340_9PEZI|nr:hypothetical protein FGG08_005200 [Glutinoglossum americanum]
MASRPRRHRSSTAASASPMSIALTAELEPLINSLQRPLTAHTPDDLQVQSQTLHHIRQLLIESDQQSKPKDVFRHQHGFQALLTSLLSVSGFYNPRKLSDEGKVQFFELIRATLGVLAEALRGHWGNRRYFTKRIEGGGWAALEQAIASTGVAGVGPEADPDDESREENLFGCLIAFALADETLVQMFGSIRRHLAGKHTLHDDTHCGVEDKGGVESHGGLPKAPLHDANTIKCINQRLRNCLGDKILLFNPEIIPTVVNLWLALPRRDTAAESSLKVTSLSVLLALKQIATSSKYNLVAIHTTGVLSTILPYVFDSSISPWEADVLEEVADILATLGVTQLEDAYCLFRNASSSGRVAEFLLRAIRSSRGPPHIQFDLSLHGFSSVELSTLGRTFPPTSSSAGYTFTGWIHVDRFDPQMHTTIFGVFDTSQTCFLLAYIERDTKKFILQTSVTSAKASVRFKSTTFEEGRWYHLGLVHRRPRTTSSSKAALFIDGEFVEQVKCQYPASPPLQNSSTDSFASLSSSGGKHNPVQVFLGTPADLSSRLGRDLVFSRWSLASAHLFDESLSDDLIAVHYRLGPRYNGNFQDCLGSFQTYEASAALNMRNEIMHPGKEEKSEIVSAIRQKASSILPESRILLNISPTAVLDDDDRNNIDESQLIKSLSKSAAKNLQQLTRSGGNAIVINGAVPFINDALTQPHGVATLTGEPIVVVPQSLDDASWRVGGSAAVGIKLVEMARTREAVVRAVEILFESVKGSWRNSEAMERENGFGILGALLRGKIGAGAIISSSDSGYPPIIEGGLEERDKLSFELLSLVLGFVGYQHDKPEESIIVNPLAYRILLVDFDMWRKTACITQKQYYKQFVTFGNNSKFHHFNSRRLFRMRMVYLSDLYSIVKKLIGAMKVDTFSPEVFPEFMAAFKSLVSSNMSSDVLRSLSLFITYALHKSDHQPARTLRSRKSTLQIRQKAATSPARSGTITQFQPGTNSNTLSRSQIGVKVLEMYSELLCEETGTVNIKKFARTVTNKWLLYLLAEDDARVVVLGVKILARLLISHGPGYVSKFATKTGGFVVMRHRLKRWWNIPTIWPICFAILFNHDVAHIDFGRPFELYSLLETFSANGAAKVVYPEVFPVIASMLQNGLKTIVMDQKNPDSPLRELGNGDSGFLRPNESAPKHTRRRSMSLNVELASLEDKKPTEQRLSEYAVILHTISRFLIDIHTKSQSFRDFAVSSNYVQELLFVLFPVIVSSDTVSPETELNSRDSALTFDGSDVVIRPLSHTGNRAPPIVRTTTIDIPPSPTTQRAAPLRRGSSFVLITSDQSPHSPSSARLTPVMSPKSRTMPTLTISNSVVEGLLEIVIAAFMDQILERKEFPGFGLHLKVPPGFQEHQVYFESYLLRNTLSQLGNTLQLNQKLLWEPKVITNMARFTSHVGEAVFEGWFLSGAEPLLDFTGTILEYLQRPDVAQIKSVRLCSQAISTIRLVFLRVVLLRLSELDEPRAQEKQALSFLDKLLYWQTIILSPENTEAGFLRLICYLLYTKLIDPREEIRLAAANLWRFLLVQKPTETSAILNHATNMDQKRLSSGFKKLMELDNRTFIYWVDDHREDLDSLFFGAMSKSWEDFVSEENRKTEECARSRTVKRKEKLRHWLLEESADEDTFRRHEVASNHWMNNIYASEHLKHQRVMQDHQDNLSFIASAFTKLDQDLRRPCGLLDDDSTQKWQLDQTEGRNRMRLRVTPDIDAHQHDYQPKRKLTDNYPSSGLKLDTKIGLVGADAITVTPTAVQNMTAGDSAFNAAEPSALPSIVDEPQEQEEDFELVEDPRSDEDGYEDKNRKVMRSLQRGDQVQHVYNVSRIVGLEACEGLLILGKVSLYLMDNFFQRSDGEIVNVWQAPREERDPYLQMISGRESSDRKSNHLSGGEHESRNWKWGDVVSISKRRFLFRDVAIEVFFTDGRSYLLTAIGPHLRNELYIKLTAKAPHISGGSVSPHPEDSWRLEALKSPEDAPQTFGSKFANVFSPIASNPAMRKWVKGEISNFHYLMLVNTMAGRTFNDLTQYPVFPWVLADYTSDELDLTNPRTFRDLSKPMGCQNLERQAEFRDRYHSFAEMGDHNAPPFHYGTHYSSAMIVTSYLIRLQPFVKSYLLLQGGSFDHADRLFYSIEKAWISASRDNMTDVRELIPEFFYLPEFLSNSNSYNFGVRQGTGEAIDSVVLPPWAKGDPNIFIAKHREALESPHVSKHLHEWIDLVFGFKQMGEAALEATNVFHHLSYRGAKDLDNIEDPVERLATIGIIHNFGQTPHQVFQRSHPQREAVQHKFKRLDTAAESLTRLPFPLLGKLSKFNHSVFQDLRFPSESNERVSSLLFSSKYERLLCSAAFRLDIPPNYDKYMEWGFADGSVRFYFADTKKQLAGLFEHLHQGQLSCALFADSRTLITAGMDGTISVWAVISGPKAVDLQPKNQCARINDVTGNIMLCRGQNVALYTLNGQPLLDQPVCDTNDDHVVSCAFYEGTGNEWLERDILFTGHKRGVVNIWNKRIHNGEFQLEHIKRLNHVDQFHNEGMNVSCSMTCILPMAQVVYTGDENGRVYEWDCVQRHDGSQR